MYMIRLIRSYEHTPSKINPRAQRIEYSHIHIYHIMNPTTHHHAYSYSTRPLAKSAPEVFYLSIPHILHRPILIDMDIQPLGLVVHGAHAVRLEHAVFLGEILFRECLHAYASASIPPLSCLIQRGSGRRAVDKGRCIYGRRR